MTEMSSTLMIVILIMVFAALGPGFLPSGADVGKGAADAINETSKGVNEAMKNVGDGLGGFAENTAEGGVGALNKVAGAPESMWHALSGNTGACKAHTGLVNGGKCKQLRDKKACERGAPNMWPLTGYDAGSCYWTGVDADSKFKASPYADSLLRKRG